MLIQINQGTFYYNEKKIFENVDLVVNDNDRIGFVGYNGEGKTTLINTLTKNYELTSGAVSHKSNLSYGYLRQNQGLDSEKTVYSEMLSVFDELVQVEKQITVLADQMSKTSHESREYESIAKAYGDKLAFFESQGGYEIDVKIKTVLNGMGFSRLTEQVVNTLSGGEKTRLAICKLLLIAPELLILDEPTNHLDYETLTWLEGHLSTYKGALLIVSHDRYFLDRLVNKIWDIENFGVTVYNGNYTKYKELKAVARLVQSREFEKQQKQIAAMTEYAERNIARDSTSNSAKSRLHQLANMTVIDKPLSDKRPPRFNFSYALEPIKKIITVKNLTLYGGDKLLLNDCSIEVLRGEKVALIGSNGCGKSTFIKSVVKSTNDDWSKIKLGDNVRLSYYDQENLNLDPDDTVLEALWNKHYKMAQSEIRNLLAQVQLTAEDVDKRVSQLSGGEKAKLGLASMIIEKANTLILDEPTNHLDLASRESLEEGLKNFGGTILFVSHDRYFINSIATKIVEIKDLQFNEYLGNFDNYLNEVARQNAPQEITVSQVKAKVASSGYVNAKQKKVLVNAKLELKNLESEIEELENTERQLYEDMSNPVFTNDYVIMQSKCDQLESVKKSLESKMSRWEELSELLAE